MMDAASYAESGAAGAGGEGEVVAGVKGKQTLFERLKAAIDAPPELSEPPPELVQWSTNTFSSGYARVYLSLA